MIRLAIALGGLAGAFARFGLGEWVTTWAGGDFPWATFGINLSGSLLLGSLMWMLPLTTVSAATRAGLTVGVCGGFTTFSAFSYETVTLLQRGAWGLASLYVAASAVGSVLAVVVGMSVAALLLRRRLANVRTTLAKTETAWPLGHRGDASHPRGGRTD